jgi:Anti-sigma-K factor rskA/Putative zinc-finger
MNTMSHDDIRSLLPAYALDAIDHDERLVIADHLESCDECSFDVIELLDTASVVALSSIESPPASLWSKISAGMAQSQTVTPPEQNTVTAAQSWPAVVRPETVVDLTDDLPDDLTDDLTVQHTAPVVDLAQRRAGRSQRGVSARVVITAFTSAAAAILIIGPIAQSLYKPKPPTVSSLAIAAAKTEGARTIEMVSSAGSVTRIGDVIVTKTGEGFIRVDDLPVLPDGKSYQLWTVVDGKPVSAGLLGARPSVAAFVISPNAQAVALSVEDEVGATQPTIGPIAVASLA